MVANGRKVRFHHTLPFMTKQRSRLAVRLRRPRDQKFGIIDTSVATYDILTNMISDVMFSDKFLMSDALATNLMLTGFLFFSTFPLISGRKQVRFMIFKFLSSISHPNQWRS